MLERVKHGDVVLWHALKVEVDVTEGRARRAVAGRSSGRIEVFESFPEGELKSSSVKTVMSECSDTKNYCRSAATDEGQRSRSKTTMCHAFAHDT